MIVCCWCRKFVRAECSYQDSDGIRHSVEVTAETLYEAAVLGIKALQLANWSSAPIMIDITVKAPETTHTIKTTALSSWLSGMAGVLASRCSRYGCANCSVSSSTSVRERIRIP